MAKKATAAEMDQVRLIKRMMIKAGERRSLVEAAESLAEHYEGIRDLMRMWKSEADETERAIIISDIQDLINDIAAGYQ